MIIKRRKFNLFNLDDIGEPEQTVASCASQENQSTDCCCGPASKDKLNYRNINVTGKIQTENGEIDIISTKWNFSDYFGTVMVRLGISRMDYALKPGLYAVGKPDKNSNVLVTANYKLTFDVVRKELEGLNLWVLVLDTKGINVWCAAGKGTFGTMEIVKRIGLTGLEKIVDTRKLIAPQLGAPGVAAHIVQGFTGFNVIYGPVRADDIKRYLAAGLKADAKMRKVTFGLWDRLAVSWLELAMALKTGIIVSIGLIVAALLISKLFPEVSVVSLSIFLVLLFWNAVFAGTFLTPALLPYIPGRAFSFKGAVAGLIAAMLFIKVSGFSVSALPYAALLTFSSAVSAYLALNYTGASTYTSLSGVKKEIKFALPIIIGMLLVCGVMGAAAIIGRFL